MSFVKKIFGEFIDVIEWNATADQADVLAYRFPRYNNEIKYGAQLTVRPGQAAVFINEGRIADVFAPGRYELKTKNIPILSTLMGWKHTFQSPFKADVIFVETTDQPSHKWGTANPIMMRDDDFGVVRLRAYGSYVMRVSDPASFITQLVSTDPQFEDYEIGAQLSQTIVARFSDVLGKCKIPVLDLVGNYEKLSKFVSEAIKPEFSGWGIDISKFYVENISVPAAVEEAMDRRTSMGVVGDLDKYAKFQAAEAMREAAVNPAGGAAGAGVGLGAGMVMAQQMAQAMPGVGGVAPATVLPPPLPQAPVFHVALNGQAAGPFSEAQLRELIAQKQLTSQSMVWSPGFPEWKRAEEVASLLSLLAAVPPPVPK